MNITMSESASVIRILYKEIKDGDLRKFIAESNDSKTGGGARDLRFGSYSKLESVIRLMFPETVRQVRRRNGVKTDTILFKGELYWKKSNGNISKQEVLFEPPTDARSSEGRITRVHEYECLAPSNIPEILSGNKVLLLMIQLSDLSVWPYFATEQSFRTPGLWHLDVAKIILSCLDARRPARRSIIGSYDFLTKESYCNGQ